MSQNWSATVTISSDADDILSEFFDRLATLRSSWAGASAPGSPVEGQLFDLQAGAASGDDELQAYNDPDGAGNGWHEVGSFLHNDLEFIGAASTGYQVINARLENRGTDVTPASGYIGRVYHHTGVSRAKVLKDASTLDILVHGSNADLGRIQLPSRAWALDASNPPTEDATVGTTPTIRGLLFNATNEIASIGIRVPSWFSGDADLTLRTFWALHIAETANDDLDLTVDLVSVQPDNGESLTQTSTQYTGTKDIGANNAQGDLTTVDITLTYNDANNPIAAGDFIYLEMHLTNVTGVAAALFVDADLLVPFGGHLWES